jgi:hypothetical protein
MPSGDWAMMHNGGTTWVPPKPIGIPTDECDCDKRCPKCGKLKKAPSYNPYPWAQPYQVPLSPIYCQSQPVRPDPNVTVWYS